MGKYKLWLHHQEIGRRLRDQISTLEQERARVQKMAPAHATSLPELENPIITALLSYTQAGNRLSNIDVIQAAMPPLDNDPDQRQPALSGATTAGSSATAPAAAPAADEAVVARLLARAEQMSGDPLEQMQALARSREAADYIASSESPAAAASAQAMQTGASAQRADSASTGSSSGSSDSAASSSSAQANSVGGWWQRRQMDDE